LKDFTENNGIYTLELDQSNGIEAGRTYTVTETGANIEKYTRVTTVRVNGGEETTAAEEATASVTVSDDGIGAVVVTNKYSKEKTEISGRKTWIDGGRAHDDIGKEIVLHLERAPKSDTEQSDWELLADAVPEWKKENGIYTYTYSGLDKYTDADDQGNAAEYQYRVTEHSVNVKERAEDGSERVVKYRMETDPEDQNSFINTELTAFDFTKKWQNMKSEDQNTWPADREIEVKIVRIAGSEEDQEFALVYKLNAGNYSSQDGIEPDSEQSKGTERPKLTFRPGTEGTAFSFHLEGLTKFDGEKTYEYYVSETNQLEGYDMPQYFAKDGTPVEEGAALGGKAPDGGTIVNKESTGYELPSTGGTGTMLYTVSGMLLIGAVVLLKLMKHAARFLWT
ncbi:MAG: Cna B-type domain-containing protein, partial [Stomatobaculum sp.]|nr:Cna B-type domain-containing protein [Stomatobaculum sp.]